MNQCIRSLLQKSLQILENYIFLQDLRSEHAVIGSIWAAAPVGLPLIKQNLQKIVCCTW